MKKIISIILASFVAFAAFAAEKLIPAVMLQDEGYLFVEEDGKMTYKMSIPAGSELDVLTVKNENGVVVPEVKQSKRIVSEKLRDCECYHVKYNNKPYWCLTNRIGLNEKIGIIIKDSSIYRSPDVCDVKEKSFLTVGTVISYGDVFLANNKIKLAKISYYDSTAYEVYTGYVKLEKISSSKDDYKGIKIIKSIKKILSDGEKADKGLLEENYKNFKHLNTSPALSQMCDELMNPAEDGDVESAESAAMDASTPFHFENAIINAQGEESNINIRNIPSSKNSKVIGQFDGGVTTTGVYVYNRSAETEVIDGVEDYWYYVEDGKYDKKGWVFGQYILFPVDEEEYDSPDYDDSYDERG